ncbi:MAG: hypothetical protein H0U03_08035 [Actinobacteria bacterium]|nr:hypothetical protein [Actinomycetota bacterium]
MLTMPQVEIREGLPRVQSFTTTTARLISADSRRTVRANLDRYLAQGRDLLVTEAALSSFSSADVTEELTARVALMIQGYHEMADVDLELAEADLPATYEVLPPE